MEVTMQYSNTSFSFKKWIILTLLILLAVTGGLALSHATKHRGDAITTRNCIDKNGVDLSYFKTDTRNVQLCFIGLDATGKFTALGIRVLEKINGKWEELTSYMNRDITTLEGAVGYADMDMGSYGYISFVKDAYKAVLTIFQ